MRSFKCSLKNWHPAKRIILSNHMTKIYQNYQFYRFLVDISRIQRCGCWERKIKIGGVLLLKPILACKLRPTTFLNRKAKALKPSFVLAWGLFHFTFASCGHFSTIWAQLKDTSLVLLKDGTYLQKAFFKQKFKDLPK